MIDRYAFGQKPEDIKLAEQIMKLNDDEVTSEVSSLIEKLHVFIKSSYGIYEKRMREFVADQIRVFYFERADELNVSLGGKTLSFLKGSINGKVVDFIKNRKLAK